MWLIYTLAALVGLGIGLSLGTWYERRVRSARVDESLTYTPNGVILLDGATGKPENIIGEGARELSLLEEARNHHVERIGKLFEEAMKKWEQKEPRDTV
jgi:hypothetical protein